MIQIADSLQRLQAEFAQAGIASDKPGFYESFAFIRCENKDPNYFENYARLVQWQKYRPGYLDWAEQVVHVVVAEMQLALQQDLNKDACVEMPLVMSRMLEREGVWNYVVHGALHITFPPGSGFDPVCFPAVDVRQSTSGEHGYQWLFVPPFQALDMTVSMLHYPYPVTHLLPKVMLGNDAVNAEGYAAEILTPAALTEADKDGLSPEESLDRFAPDFRSRFAPDFPAHLITRNDARFKYIPTRVFAPEKSLEEFTGFVSQGRTAIQLYDQQIHPRLLKE